MFLQIISDNLIKKNLLKFNINWINKSIKNENVCFAFSKILRKIIDDILNMKMIIYVFYRYLQNNEKIFKKLKTRIRNDISKFYKNLASSLYLLIKFNAKLFNFNRHFLTTMKTSIFFAIKNAIVDRRI